MALKNMDDKKLDLKLGTEEVPTGIGQPEQKQTPTEAAELEIQDEEIQPDESDDDSVVLSREKFDKLVELKENYKKGLLSLKEKTKQNKPQEEKGEYLSKQDFYKANEKTAIDKFVKENPEIEEKWSDFVKHYSGTRGKDTADGIIQDLDDAKTLFVKYNPSKEKSENKEVNSNLSKEISTPSKTGPEGKSPQKGGVIPKKEPITEWYKTEE